MKIGIIADTHDNIYKTSKAVEMFNDRDVAEVIHAGDIISPFTAKIFSNLKGGFTAIYGNNDGDKNVLASVISSFGRIEPPPLFVSLCDLDFCVVHDDLLIEPLSKKLFFDVIIYGHLHEPDVVKGKPLIINPGECCGYLSGKSTLAILDSDRFDVEIIGI